MQYFSLERRKAALHEDWLNRQTYRKHFATHEPLPFPRNWSGNPDPCKCGCGSVEYSRSDPANWWESFSPKLLWETRLLIPIFASLYKVLWSLLVIFWGSFLDNFDFRRFKHVVIANPTGNKLGASIVVLKFLAWPLSCLVSFALCILLCLGVALLIPLYVASLALFVTILLVVWVIAAIYISLHGIVFLVGGAASILYLSNPVIGILLIVAGVAVEYETRRRRERHHREEVGRLLRFIENRTHNNPAQGVKLIQ